MASSMPCFVSAKRLRPDLNDDDKMPTLFTIQGKIPTILIIKSYYEKPVTSLSPFIIEKQIQCLIGTVKSVEKHRDDTLLIETSTKRQTENLSKINIFFNLPVTVPQSIKLIKRNNKG